MNPANVVDYRAFLILELIQKDSLICYKEDINEIFIIFKELCQDDFHNYNEDPVFYEILTKI